MSYVVLTGPIDKVVEHMNAKSQEYVPYGPLKFTASGYVQVMVKKEESGPTAVWEYFTSSGAMIHLPNMDDAPTLMEAAYADVLENLNAAVK